MSSTDNDGGDAASCDDVADDNTADDDTMYLFKEPKPVIPSHLSAEVSFY